VQAEIGEPRSGSGHLLQEDPSSSDQVRDEGMADDGGNAEGGLSKRSASMWNTQEKDSFMQCFKVLTIAPLSDRKWQS
jgi:hypothetical protein